MKLKDIRIGESYRVREWDDMDEEYGTEGGEILIPKFFVKSMRYLCGQTFTVSSIDIFENVHSVEGIEGIFDISAEMLQLPFPEAAEDGFEAVDISGFLI